MLSTSQPRQNLLIALMLFLIAVAPLWGGGKGGKKKKDQGPNELPGKITFTDLIEFNIISDSLFSGTKVYEDGQLNGGHVHFHEKAGNVTMRTDGGALSPCVDPTGPSPCTRVLRFFFLTGEIDGTRTENFPPSGLPLASVAHLNIIPACRDDVTINGACDDGEWTSDGLLDMSTVEADDELLAKIHLNFTGLADEDLRLRCGADKGVVAAGLDKTGTDYLHVKCLEGTPSCIKWIASPSAVDSAPDKFVCRLFQRKKGKGKLTFLHLADYDLPFKVELALALKQP